MAPSSAPRSPPPRSPIGPGRCSASASRRGQATERLSARDRVGVRSAAKSSSTADPDGTGRSPRSSQIPLRAVPAAGDETPARFVVAARRRVSLPSATTSREPAPPADQYTVLDLAGDVAVAVAHRRGRHVARRAGNLAPASRSSGADAASSATTCAPSRSAPLDRVPFQCNQRPWYRQRALYDVTADVDAGRVPRPRDRLHDEPSPCDHGFRHVGDYTALPHGKRLALHWDAARRRCGRPAARAARARAPWPQTFESDRAVALGRDELRRRRQHPRRDRMVADHASHRHAPRRHLSPPRDCPETRTVSRSPAPARRAGRSTTPTSSTARRKRSTGASRARRRARRSPVPARHAKRTLDEATAEQIGGFHPRMARQAPRIPTAPNKRG